MYTVKDITGSIVITVAKTERAAVAAGRRNEREAAKFGICADGFKVYDENNKLIRVLERSLIVLPRIAPGLFLEVTNERFY